MNRIRVAVVEDHPIYRDGLLQAVADTPDLELVGTAASVAEAHALLDPSGPDVVLLDLGLPDGSGLDVLSTMRARGSEAAVVVLTMNDDPELVLSATRAGARGYLVKGAGREEVVDAVRRAATGGAVYNQGAADVIITAASRPASDPAADHGLTARERDVLRLIADGLSNEVIGARLGIATKTARNHVCAVLAKLGLENRRAAAEWVKRHAVPADSGRAVP